MTCPTRTPPPPWSGPHRDRAAGPNGSITQTINHSRLSTADNQNTPGVPHVVLTSAYDNTGNRTRLADNLGGYVAYAYDADNRLTQFGMAVTGISNTPLVTLDYDLGARLTSIKRTATTGGPEVDTTLGYTARDQVNSIADTYTGGALNLSYTYDAARRLKNYTGPDGSLIYSYDASNQLTGVGGAHTESYSYANAQGQDLNGNRASAVTGQGTAQTYGTPAAGNRLTTDGTYTYTYDPEGNLLSKSGAPGGVPTTYTYTWDFRNRLTEAKLTVNGATQADDHFTYDVFDRRIGKLTQGGTQQWTVYDGANVYADFNGTALATRYLYGNGVDELYARMDAAGNAAWYLTDNLGSVRQIVAPAGTVLYAVSFDSFGNILPGSESGTGGDRFKYAGREWDSEAGLYYNRARYYDPNTGRFLGEDPEGFAAGDANLYRYVSNGPPGRVDPTGLQGFNPNTLLPNPPFPWRDVRPVYIYTPPPGTYCTIYPDPYSPVIIIPGPFVPARPLPPIGVTEIRQPAQPLPPIGVTEIRQPPPNVITLPSITPATNPGQRPIQYNPYGPIGPLRPGFPQGMPSGPPTVPGDLRPR